MRILSVAAAAMLGLTALAGAAPASAEGQPGYRHGGYHEARYDRHHGYGRERYRDHGWRHHDGRWRHREERRHHGYYGHRR